ncbi:aminotransferase class IV [Aeoliella mucimassa]|uniref:branched-chain-amino-acid transaminase n=1 Tax=Aeoliella mucimassa TaxID=2527972 RepID=A0A518AVB4_9BACT|nr:aminotransferase class IV [Aeoliella mucimassa]QDU58653.1 Branched-chain-amino-acid aminotransferase [Aeoliella mucimassa]
MSNRQAYYCGQWIAEHQLSIPVGDLGFSMGITATERLRTFGGQLFREHEHLRRMGHSLDIIGLPAESLVAELTRAIEEYVPRHAAQITPGDDWAVVAFVTPGSGSGPTVAVHGLPIGFGEWADQFESGVSLYVSDHRQVPPNCWPAELKCRSRMHYYLADQQARRREARARALLLDQQGFVGEGSTANVAIYHQQTGIATPKSTKVLPGVSVAVLAELAAAAGIAFTERDITLDEFLAADEVWLTSTSICMLPVVAVDNHPIGSGTPGPVYQRLLADWSTLVGVDIAEQARTFAVRSS